MIALLLVLLVASCRYLSFPPVNDLRLVSVDLVPQSEIPKHDKFWEDGVITRPLLRVTFTSRHDFQALAHAQSYYVGQTTGRCRTGEVDLSRKLEGFPGLLDATGRIDEFSTRKQSGDQSGHPIPYHLYFDVEQHGIYGWQPYDLRHSPEDICIQLSGYRELLGEIPLWRFHSNILIVPKSRLVSALIH